MKLRIRKKTLVLFSCIFLIAAVLCSGISLWIYRYWSDHLMEDTVMNVSEGKRAELTDYFQQIDEVAYNVAYSNWLQELFVAEATSNFSDCASNIQKNMSSLSFLYADIRFAVETFSGTQVVGIGMNNFDTGYRIEEQDWYDELVENKVYLLSGEGQPYVKLNPEEYLTVFYIIKNYNSLCNSGYLILRIPMKNIEKLLDSVSVDGCQVSLVLGEQIIGTNRKLQDDAVLGENAVIMSKEKLCANRISFPVHNQELSLVTVMDWGDTHTQNPIIWGICLLVILLIGLLLFGVAAAVSGYLTKPILMCKDAMQKIEHDNLGVTVENTYQDEIGELLDGFNRMSDAIYHLIEVNKNISIMQKEAEFMMLERQLSPHFLFNTLELINGLILTGQDMEAVSVCENLGQLYRYHLKQEKWITIREELEYTRHYLEVMKYKMEGLETDYEIEEAVLPVQTVKAILQPLVENSIRHGFREQKAECCISISMKYQQEMVHMTVVDNGSGMSTEVKEVLEQGLGDIREHPGEKLPDSAHVGVKNVYQRLYLEYGEALRFTITAKEHYGVRIDIWIPGGK